MMTKDEALKLALEALEEAWYHVGTFQPTEKAIDLYDESRTAIKEALAQPEQDNTYIYASNLAKTIWQKHYIKESPKFALLDTIEGVLTQIDNMTCGLVREKPAHPKQEPVKISHKHEWFRTGEMKVGQMRCISCGTWGQEEIPQRTWVGLTEDDDIDW